jgi:hypothetical protein
MDPTKTSFVKGHGAASIARQAPRTSRFATPPGPQPNGKRLISARLKENSEIIRLKARSVVPFSLGKTNLPL